jgi:hypothetical protein
MAQPSVLQREVLVGSSSMSYRDPEFLVQAGAAGGELATMAWIDQNRRVRVTSIDLATGQLVDVSGQVVGVGASYVTTQGNPPVLGSYTGPEWGLDANGPTVFFSGYDGQGVMQLYRFRDGVTSAATVAGDTPSGTEPRGSGIPTADPLASDTRFFYFLGSITSGRFAWRIDGVPSSERTLTLADVETSGPRWVPGTRTLALNERVNGVNQVALYDTNTPDAPSVVITDDPGDKSDIFFFPAVPGGATDRFFATVQGASSTGGPAIVIYAPDSGGGWQPERVLDVLAAPGIDAGSQFFSAEPFVLGCRTWISLAISAGEIFVTPARVYAISTSGGDLVELSAAPTLNRTDPESVSSSGRAYIYYYTQPDQVTGISRLFLSEMRPGPLPCPGDVDANARVGFDDVTAVLSWFGAVDSCVGDADGDRDADFDDLTAVLGNFGAACW